MKKDKSWFSTSEKEQKGKDFGGSGRELSLTPEKYFPTQRLRSCCSGFPPREMRWHLFFVLSFNFGAGGRC